MAIERRPLGRTGTDVTILGYGAMELRGQPRGPAITDEAAGQVLNAVLDAGINLIDTSVDYGRSEELITQAAAAGAGTLIRGGAARGTLADDKPGQPGPIGLPQGAGQQR